MKMSFVVPFHNEEKNVGSMIEQLAEYATTQKWNFEIIAINDKSTDLTGEIIDERAKKYNFVKPIHRKNPSEIGGNTMGTSLIEGSKKATGDIVIWTMGDKSDDVNTYGAIVDKINVGFDMVFGSRYMLGGTWGSLDPTKAFLSSQGTLLAQFLFGISVHDITNAFRGFKKSLIDKVKLESSDFAISPEFAIKTHLAGFKLGEVPTIYHTRTEGVSSFKLWRMCVAYLTIFGKLFIEKLIGSRSFLKSK